MVCSWEKNRCLIHEWIILSQTFLMNQFIQFTNLLLKLTGREKYQWNSTKCSLFFKKRTSEGLDRVHESCVVFLACLNSTLASFLKLSSPWGLNGWKRTTSSSIVVHGKTSSTRVCTHEGWVCISLGEVHFVAIYFMTSLGLKLQSVTFFVFLNLQNLNNKRVHHESIFQTVFLACPESLRYTYNKWLYSYYFRLVRVGTAAE